MESILIDFPFPGVGFYQVIFPSFSLESTLYSYSYFYTFNKKILFDLINKYMYGFDVDGSLRGGINQEGIDHYNNVINELVRNGKS